MTEASPQSLADWTPPEGWPVKTLPEVRELLCAPGQPFEMETVEIDGVPTRVWKNAFPSLAALAEHARGHGDNEFLIYNDELEQSLVIEKILSRAFTISLHFEG